MISFIVKPIQLNSSHFKGLVLESMALKKKKKKEVFRFIGETVEKVLISLAPS